DVEDTGQVSLCQHAGCRHVADEPIIKRERNGWLVQRARFNGSHAVVERQVTLSVAIYVCSQAVHIAVEGVV
ncbi:hypothetical protein, partial [Nocardioides sp.]|uniref:hypothetical protein n=1 Tax=Nocardioides sp. TaxID=35761 RepID=UPI0027323005